MFRETKQIPLGVREGDFTLKVFFTMALRHHSETIEFNLPLKFLVYIY